MVGQRFSADLQAGRGGGAFVVVPEQVLMAMGGGRRFRVTGLLNGVRFDSSTMGMGDGRVCLGVHKATRAAAGVQIGDTVELEVERDERPRQLDLPDDLRAGLAADPGVAAAFDGLPFTHRREYVEWITGAKRVATRARRLAQTLECLRPDSPPAGTH
ncbi:MAG TPA: YdeI/OmpD-associated family protein [Pseudonocardiaceae bacterium]|jgi:hypothetical protein